MAEKSVHIKKKDESSHRVSEPKEAKKENDGTADTPSPKGSPQSGAANESGEKRESAQTTKSEVSEAGSDTYKKKRGNAKFSDENQTREYDPKGRPANERHLEGTPETSTTAKDAGALNADDSPERHLEGTPETSTTPNDAGALNADGSLNSKVKGNESSEEARKLQEATTKQASGTKSDDEENTLRRENPEDEVEAKKARQSGVPASMANTVRPGGKQDHPATDDDALALKRESPDDEVEAHKVGQKVRASMASIAKSAGLEENTFRRSFNKDDEGDGNNRKSLRQSITEIPQTLRGASMRQVIRSNVKIREGSISIKSGESGKKGSGKVSMMKRTTPEEGQDKPTEVQKTVEEENEVSSNREITSNIKSSSMKSISAQEIGETHAETIPDSIDTNQNAGPQPDEGDKGMETVPPIPPAVVGPQDEKPKLQDEDHVKDDQADSLRRTIGSEDLKESFRNSVRPGSVVLVSGIKDAEGFYRVRVAQPSKVYAYNVGAKVSGRFSTLINEVVEGISGSLKKSGDEHSVYTAYTQTGDSQSVRNSILSAVTQVSPKRSVKSSIASHNASTNTDQEQTAYDPVVNGWKMDQHWNNNLYS